MKELTRKQIANLWMGTFFVMFTVFLMAGINPVCAVSSQEFWWYNSCNNTTFGNGGYSYIPSTNVYSLYSDYPFVPLAAPFNNHAGAAPYYATWIGGPWVGIEGPVLINNTENTITYSLYLGMLAPGEECVNETPANCTDCSNPFKPWVGPIPGTNTNLQQFWWYENCEGGTISENGYQTVTSREIYYLYSDQPFLPLAGPLIGHSTVAPYYAAWPGGPWVGIKGPVLVNDINNSRTYHIYLNMLAPDIPCLKVNNTTEQFNETIPTYSPCVGANCSSPWSNNTTPGNIVFPEPQWNFTQPVWNISYFPNELFINNITNDTQFWNMFNTTLIPLQVLKGYTDFIKGFFDILKSIIQMVLNILLAPLKQINLILMSILPIFIEYANGLLHYIKPVAIFFQRLFFILPPGLIYLGGFLLVLDFIWWIIKGKK